jgi:RNA polymerase sigma-70 factor, ECF subfamily
MPAHMIEFPPSGRVEGERTTRMDDEQGYVAFYAESYRRIVAELFLVTGQVWEAEELAQEAFLRAAGHWDTVRRYDLPDAWVRRVALNLASTARRRARRGAVAMLRLQAGHTEVPGIDVDRIEIVRALRQLPLSYRSVLALHYLLERSVLEIADELGLPESTVKTRLARGRRRLAQLLGIDEGEGA